MAIVLTAASVERLKHQPGRRIELPDAVLPGLYLVIQPSGQKGWAVRYRYGGKPRKVTIGPYPAFDLVAARAHGRQMLQVVSLGRDPGAEKIEEKRRARESDADQDLVSGALDSFVKRHVRPNTSSRSAEETERLFKLHVRPAWGTRRLDDIKRRDVIALLDKVVDGGSPIAANRVLAAVRKFFNWSVDRGILETSPCVRVKPPTEETSRDRVLSDDELRLVWHAATWIGPPVGSFIQILVLTGQRRDEVARMTRSERVRPDLWTIPGLRTKNGTAQDVPLVPAAQAVLNAVPEVIGEAGYVFTTNGAAPISGFAKAKARLDDAMLSILKAEAAERGENLHRVTIAPWRLHDLRRTLATGMARLRTAVHVIEAVLNHTSGQVSGVAAVYNRHRYLDEKRGALEVWAEHVQRVVAVRS